MPFRGLLVLHFVEGAAGDDDGAEQESDFDQVGGVGVVDLAPEGRFRRRRRGRVRDRGRGWRAVVASGRRVIVAAGLRPHDRRGAENQRQEEQKPLSQRHQDTIVA